MPGRLDATLAHVSVRVLQVADEDVEVFHHLLRNIGMQIEDADDWHPGADLLADQREQIAVGIVRACRQRGTVRDDKDPVQGTGLAQAIADLGKKGVKESLLDRPTRLRDGDTQR